jgi:hypothetical protein
VKAFHTQVLQEAMENGNIAAACYPLRVLKEFLKIQTFDNPDHSVSPAGTNDRFNLRIIQHFLEIRCALIIRSGKRIMTPENMFSGFHFQAPRPDKPETGFQLCLPKEAGRGCNPYGISLPQQWRTDHTLYLFEFAVI